MIEDKMERASLFIHKVGVILSGSISQVTTMIQKYRSMLEKRGEDNK
jgi:hypothetical protein